MPDPLAKLADTARDDPFFLASLLADFARSEGLDDTALSARLGCRPEVLPQLKLCRAPRPDSIGCRADIARLADHFELDADALTVAVKGGRVIQTLREAHGLMMAARDRREGTRP